MANECSISGLFQEIYNKGFKAPPSQQQQQAEPLKFGDAEGSDFKRLRHKRDKSLSDHSGPTTATTPPVYRNDNLTKQRSKIQKQYHQDSPDFRPVVYVDNNDRNSSSQSSRMMQLGTSLYSLLFQHEDRYFNNDREELSKDIFPVGHAQ